MLHDDRADVAAGAEDVFKHLSERPPVHVSAGAALLDVLA